MDVPPPVPPKDPPFLRRMAVEHHRPRPTSGSKRKRALTDEIIDASDVSAPCRGDLEYASPSKDLSAGPSDIEASTDELTPAIPRSVKRKKKVGNLSHLNLRHAAQEQEVKQEQQQHLNTRESKFQEGSLNDKPSEKPPSAFIRYPRSDCGQRSHHVDTLTTDYHEGLSTPDPSRFSTTDASTHSTAASSKEERSSGLFQYGRTLAGNFHPLSLWNKLWNQSKEELARHNEEECVHKAKPKSEVEARYAEMKRSGMFGLQGDVPTLPEKNDPRDSAVILDSGHESAEEELYIESGLLPAESNGRETPYEQQDGDVTLKPRKGLKSRLTMNMKRPSLANLKNVLRPAKSEYHLNEKADRASSSSISPVKPDLATPAPQNDTPIIRGLGIGSSNVRRSSSKYDLKRQNKLSKRVSDLESKLQHARQELDAALVDASPIPKLNNKYERFTPGPFDTVKRFQPRLPRLDSERILLGEVAREGDSEPRKAVDMTERSEDRTIRQRSFGFRMPSLSRRASFDPSAYTEMASEKDPETVKSSRSKSSYPALASLFLNKSISTANNPHSEDLADTDSDNKNDNSHGMQAQDASMTNTYGLESQDVTRAAMTDSIDEHGQSTAMMETSDSTASEKLPCGDGTRLRSNEDIPSKPSIDDMQPLADDSPAKFAGEHTPDANGGLTALNSKLKVINDQHKTLQKMKKPGKRKSRGEKDDQAYKPGKDDADDAEREEVEKQRSRKKKRTSGGSITSTRSNRTKKTDVDSTSPQDSPVSSVIDQEHNGAAAQDFETAPESEATAVTEKRKSATKRMSIDSAALEPVYEEEELAVVSVNGTPVKPAAKATPGRFTSQIPRSASPVKAASTSFGADAGVMTRAALAPQLNRDPQTPGGASATFEWPDDVF